MAKKNTNAEGQHITDKSGDPNFYIRVPRMILMKAKNPYYLSFYIAVKDFAGESGSCYLSTVALAELCKMSEGMVKEAREFWLETGYIEGGITSFSSGNPVYNLVIKNCWEENNDWSRRHVSLDSRLKYCEGLIEPKKAFQRTCKRCKTTYETTGKRSRLCPTCQAQATEESDQIYLIHRTRAKSYILPQDRCCVCGGAEDLELNLEEGTNKLLTICKEDHDKCHLPIHAMNREEASVPSSPHESGGVPDSQHEFPDSCHESKNNIQEDIKEMNNNKKEAIDIWREDILPHLERIFAQDALFIALKSAVLQAYYEDGVMCLVVQNIFQKQWLETRRTFIPMC